MDILIKDRIYVVIVSQPGFRQLFHHLHSENLCVYYIIAENCIDNIVRILRHYISIDLIYCNVRVHKYIQNIQIIYL